MHIATCVMLKHFQFMIPIEIFASKILKTFNTIRSVN
jgi:hypothetical protein